MNYRFSLVQLKTQGFKGPGINIEYHGECVKNSMKQHRLVYGV